MKNSAKEEGFVFEGYLSKGLAVFVDTSTGQLEIWQANKNHASYGFHWNNTDWEFVRSYWLESYKIVKPS